MEDDERHLWKPKGDHDARGDPDRPGQLSLTVGYPREEC